MPQSLPNLPPLSDEQFARCLATFGDAANYKRRLADWIRGEVLKAELGVVTSRQESERTAIIDDVTDNVLPTE